jgi:hypothetical protein
MKRRLCSCVKTSNFIEVDARSSVTEVTRVYNEMDPQVPVELNDRYYLRGSVPVKYVVDGF